MRSLIAPLALVAMLVLAGAALAQEDANVLARFIELAKAGNQAEIVKMADKVVPAAEQLLADSPEALANAFGMIAEAYNSQGQYALAEPLYKRALAIREKSLGPDHPDTALSLNNLAGLYYAQGQYALAEPLYKRALAICEKSLGPDHPTTATSFNNLAALYNAQGQYALAEPLYKRALPIREKSLGLDHPDTATSLSGLAVLYNAQGQYALAEQLYKRALTIYEKSLGSDHPHTATSLNNLAQLYGAQGQYALAEPLYKRALAIWEKSLGPDHPDTATSLSGLAVLYNAQGQYALAEPLYTRALAIKEKSLGPNHPDTATSLNSLAFLYDTQGQYALAEPLYKRALAAHEKSLGPDHPLTAHSLNNLAGLYYARGQSALAEPLYKRGLAIFEKSLGADHPSTATSLNNLAFLYEAQGQYALAEPLYKRALAAYEKSLGPDHPSTALSLNNLAVVEAARGRFPAAAGLIDRARRGSRRHVARVLPSLSAAEQAVFLRTQDQGDFHAALTLGLLKKSTPEIARLSAGWLANGKAVGQEAASQQIILARQSQNPGTAAAVAAIEKVRADLAKLSQMKPASDEAAAYRAKLAELQAEEHRLVHEIGGQLALLDRDEPWIEIDAIRKNIPAGSVLVDIAWFDIFDFAAKGKDKKWQPARYAAWVIPPAGKGDVTILDLGPAEAIDALVATYRKGIDAVSVKNGFARGHFTLETKMRQTARPVTQAVLEPILAALAKAGLSPSEIILSPDGALWLLPWQALPLGDGEEAPYAIEQFAFRTVTSGRDLVPPPDDARPKTQSTRGPVVVADPAFDATPPTAAGSDKPAEPTRGIAPAGRRLEPVIRLPATLAEARASAAALQKIFSREPKTLTGTAASEENVKKEAVRPPALVLATHGYVLPDQMVVRDDSASLAGGGSNRSTRAVTTTGEPIEDPLLRCGLLLAGANLTNSGKTLPGDDGILTGAEIVGLDLLGTDLVVLSACQTGEGQVNTGEGVAGLRQAFQIAGARSVVATLWTVPDAESAWIMAGFYANVAKGQPASKALREAQLAFIKARRADRNYESAHPYHWAAYSVTGR